MEISANAAVNAAMQQQQAYTQQEVQVSMLKKAMDVQTQGALSLIEALPAPTPSTQGLPANLGNNINVTA
ncbi:hypothetical protein AVO42_02325 [Thiomicrospira sp. XS5]|uniref:YjfB family protein n=1 Tax=Thiomicrospira sp. XS5 TaxID=1775636 RepID=UPI000749A4A8|nr:YjfB family protein [Thiomicrospira sp. XS5]KUJ74271.1 hypothetical protein AVO42_02325 [Thiomicrospira sp. XS5]